MHLSECAEASRVVRDSTLDTGSEANLPSIQRKEQETYAAGDGCFSKEALLHLLQEVLAVAGAAHGWLQALGAEAMAHREERGFREGLGHDAEMMLVRLPLTAVSWVRGKERPRVVPLAVMPMEDHVSLAYRGQPIGRLSLTFADADSWQGFQEMKPAVARELALLLMRQQIRWRALQAVNLEVALIGVSAVQRVLEGAIERASAVSFPVVLQGEFGMHDLQLAAAIHFASERHGEPFVPLDCACCLANSFGEDLDQALCRAVNGTVFLGSVDLLQEDMQRELLTRRREGLMGQRVRLVVSTTRPLGALVQQGVFCRMLRNELDYLRIAVPPLRERSEDIPLLLEHRLLRMREHGPKRFTPEALAMCMEYAWPENDSELVRFSTRLAVMCVEEEIGVEELRRSAAWFPEPAAFAGDSRWPVCVRETGPDVEGTVSESAAVITERGDEDGCAEGLGPMVRQELGELPQKLIAADFSGMEVHGVGLQRALRHIANNYSEEISMSDLAREAYVSPSHLSFLFKRSLGFPFKTVLAAVRIEKARQLLSTEPQRSITEISLDVGFGDLSHFERTFKRLAGKNPREFRRQRAEERQRRESERQEPHVARTDDPLDVALGGFAK